MKASHEDLFRRYQSGEATPEEQALVEDYILNNAFNPLHLTEEELAAAEVKLGKRIKQIPLAGGTTQPGSSARPIHRRWTSLAAVPAIWKAAAAVAAITLGVWLFYTSSFMRNVTLNLFQGPGLATTNDIAPGKNTATLTLANGTTILLDTNRNSVVVADSVRSSTMLAATTPRGGTYQFTLPDGTKVWLNADSKIEFASNFLDKNTRKLKLVGEAYFEVAKNKRKPFIVESRGQRVEVLGTHFNVSSYPDEGSTKTTLIEGSVKVSPLSSRALSLSSRVSEGSIVLKPNEQATLAPNQPIQVKAVNTETIVDWKENDFVFNGEDFKAAMRKIARWYDVEVVYDENLPGDIEPGGWVSRNTKLSEVLKLIEASGQVHFKIEGRRVRVTK